MESSKDSGDECCARTTAISGKRQEMGSELVRRTRHFLGPNSGIYPYSVIAEVLGSNPGGTTSFISFFFLLPVPPSTDNPARIQAANELPQLHPLFVAHLH